jgi:hypothetical protein
VQLIGCHHMARQRFHQRIEQPERARDPFGQGGALELDLELELPRFRGRVSARFSSGFCG